MFVFYLDAFLGVLGKNRVMVHIARARVHPRGVRVLPITLRVLTAHLNPVRVLGDEG